MEPREKGDQKWDSKGKGEELHKARRGPWRAEKAELVLRERQSWVGGGLVAVPGLWRDLRKESPHASCWLSLAWVWVLQKTTGHRGKGAD